MSQQKDAEQVHGRISLVRLGFSFVLKTISIGAFMGLVGYGVGIILSSWLGEDLSFAGLVSVPVGMGLWAGICGLVVGLGIAFLQYARRVE